MCHMSYSMGRMSCHVSHVECHVSPNFFLLILSKKIVDPVDGGMLSMGLPRLVFKASALWADAFYKSKCPSVCMSVCLSVHF